MSSPAMFVCLFICLIPCRGLCLSTVILLCLSTIIVACLFVVRILYEPCIVACVLLHFKLSHYFIIAYMHITPVPETMAGGTASVKGMGEILQLCVSHLRGFVCFFLFAEVRSGRMSSYDPRSWGHLPKELFASCSSV